MNNEYKTEKKIKFPILLQIVAIFYWLTFLRDSDSYYIPYLIVGSVGIFCCYINVKETRFLRRDREQLLPVIMSALFCLLVAAANYSMFLDLTYPENSGARFKALYTFIIVILVLLGGFFSAWNLIICFTVKFRNYTWEKKQNSLNPTRVFGACAALMSVMNLFFLFMSKYPGNLTVDSISQIGQILSGVYSNHHPFYHTMVIKLFMSIGLVWGDINTAVAVYSTFQVIFMSCCFSFVVVTLYQMNICVKKIIICVLWYVMMPFHIMYSFTMWKDIMFSGMFAVFVVAVYRNLKNIGKNQLLNTILAAVGSIGICLLRSNGWFAYLLSFLCFVFLFRRDKKRISVMFAMILVFTFILKHGVLEYLNVSQPDTIEALSVPAQQIARVVTDCNDLTNEQRELLNQIIDVDAISSAYRVRISNPIKNLIREKDNQDYIAEHKGEYIKLYLELGLRHPHKYIEAWIDQTRGYWNGGYRYWRWLDGVSENEFGIESRVSSKTVDKFLDYYLWIYSENAALQIFLCIGFHVWLTVLLGYISLIRKDKAAFFIIIPILAIVVSLMVATPVFAEFRYIYALFCSVPFYIFASFAEREPKQVHINSGKAEPC